MFQNGTKKLKPNILAAMFKNGSKNILIFPAKLSEMYVYTLASVMNNQCESDISQWSQQIVRPSEFECRFE